LEFFTLLPEQVRSPGKTNKIYMPIVITITIYKELIKNEIDLFIDSDGIPIKHLVSHLLMKYNINGHLQGNTQGL